MRFYCRFPRPAVLFILGFTLVAAGNALAFNLDSLLVQSVGGPEAVERLRSLRSRYETGSVSYSGRTGRYEDFFLSPDMVRSEMTLGPLKVVQAYDGAVAWTQDQNGAVSEIAGYQKREIAESVWMQSHSFLFKDRHPGSIEYLGLSERDGRQYHMVAFYPFNEDTTLCFFDPATAYEELQIDKADGLESVTRFDDYRLVEGVLVPFHVTNVLTEANVTMEYWAEKVLYDSAIDRSIFTQPDESASDYRFATQCDSVRIPFASKGGHIHVPVTINGKRFRFILDSGASVNVVDATVVKDFDLPEAGKASTRGIAGFEDVGLVKIDSMAVGEIVLLSQVAAVADLKIPSLVADEPFGGLLGYDFLSRFPVLVDFANKSLTVYNPRTFKSAEGGAEVPFFLTGRVPTVRAILDGVPGDFIIDLGNSGKSLVHSESRLAKELGGRLRDVTEGNSGAVFGIGGKVASRRAVVSEFVLGGISWRDVSVDVTASSSGVGGSTELAGNIGVKTLRGYRVLFDYPGSRIILYPPSTAE
jgi:predicted aspartyl protease